MKWPKTIFIAAIAAVFVGSTFVALFGAGEVLTATFRTYVFEVEQCRFDLPPRIVALPPDVETGKVETGQQEQPQEVCEVDTNDAKREIANGLARFAVAAPLAAVAFFFSWRMVREARRGK